MDGFQGAVLNVKLEHLDEWTAKRQEYAALYRQLLADAPVDLPEDAPDVDCVYHLFVVYVNQRDKVRSELADRGVQTAVHYPKPVHLQGAFQHLGYHPGSLPHAERACERVLSMPIFPEMSREQVEYAARALVEVTK